MSAAECACGTCLTCTTEVPRRPVGDPLVFRHGAIKARLLSRIASTEIDGNRPLDPLGTREDDDPAMALIDAFSGALHVLAWNAARLADDGSLRRTEDRDALVDLTGLLGYDSRPALSATTTLAFTVDAFDGSPKAVTVPKGSKVASVPEKDEQPQIFETDVEIEARAEWNALTPVQQKTVPAVTSSTTSITIAGASTIAKPGDLVLVYLEPQTANSWLLARIASITRQPTLDPPRTVIDLAAPAGLTAIASMKGSAFKNTVVILGQRASAFGATAPDMTLMPTAVQDSHGTQDKTEWKTLEMPSGGTTTGGTVDLDAVYPDAMKGRFTVFTRPNATTVTQLGSITSATELSRKGFGLAAKVTRIVVDGIDLSETGFKKKVRETAIFVETAREPLFVEDAVIQLPAPLTKDRINVNGKVTLAAGRRLVIAGELFAPAAGQLSTAAEIALLKSSTPQSASTELVFERALINTYKSTTMTLQANAASASHGDTPAAPAGGEELIGSSSTTTLSPKFELKRSPLAYVPAATPRGCAPAIEVRVGGVLFTEVPTAYGLGSEDRAYTVRTGREAKSVVQFAGRLPSGTLNVTAKYRTGGGTAGNLASGRLTTMMTPILGVRSATNAVPADGGSDAESVEDMRTAAPHSIRTLDRVVSLADFEAFARTFRGVGKALATELHIGMRSVVCLTIATTTLAVPGADLVEALTTELAKVSVPGRTVRIVGFVELTAQVAVALAINTARRRTDVEAAARTALGLRFGRAARRFGEALHRSVVLAALHDVPGVIAARLTTFALAGGPAEQDGRLLCPGPTVVNGQISPAGLLSIDAQAVQFSEMKP